MELDDDKFSGGSFSPKCDVIEEILAQSDIFLKYKLVHDHLCKVSQLSLTVL